MERIQNRFDFSQQFALDVQGVEKLKHLAKKDESEAIRAASKQFEAIFLNMMLKSMRDTIPKGGLFSDDQSGMYTSLLDQQLTQNIAGGRGVGLAEVMARQLGAGAIERAPGKTGAVGDANLTAFPLPARGLATAGAKPGSPLDTLAKNLRLDLFAHQKADVAQAPAAGSDKPATDAPKSGPRAFVERVWNYAADVARELGIPAHFLVGHAALESGWGKHEIKGQGGENSHNLFGIKAGANWKGAVVETTTTEYVNGVARKVVERFRAYPSYADAFRDYAQLMGQSPRYAGLFQGGVNAEQFATGLQKAGYATDPMYADKLERILNGATLRRALAA